MRKSSSSTSGYRNNLLKARAVAILNNEEPDGFECNGVAIARQTIVVSIRCIPSALSIYSALMLDPRNDQKLYSYGLLQVLRIIGPNEDIAVVQVSSTTKTGIRFENINLNINKISIFIRFKGIGSIENFEKSICKNLLMKRLQMRQKVHYIILKSMAVQVKKNLLFTCKQYLKLYTRFFITLF